MDQLVSLRKRAAEHATDSAWKSTSGFGPFVWAVGSGKGGVGKTAVCGAVARLLAEQGKKTLLVEGDLFLPNVHSLFCESAYDVDIDRFLEEGLDLEEICPCARENLYVFAPAESTEFSSRSADIYIEKIIAAANGFDFVIIDVANGFLPIHQKLCQAASAFTIIVSSEQASISNAYALIKMARISNSHLPLSILVNKSDSSELFIDTSQKLNLIVEHFLKERLGVLGGIPFDREIPRLLQEHHDLLEWPENLPFINALREITERVKDWHCSEEGKTGHPDRVYKNKHSFNEPSFE